MKLELFRNCWYWLMLFGVVTVGCLEDGWGLFWGYVCLAMGLYIASLRLYPREKDA